VSPVTRAKYHVLSFGLLYFRPTRVDVKGMMSKTMVLEYDYLQGAPNNAPDIDKIRVELPLKKRGPKRCVASSSSWPVTRVQRTENLRGVLHVPEVLNRALDLPRKLSQP